MCDDTPVNTVHRRRILLLTNIERGQANIFLTVAEALIAQDSNVDVHFASFHGLEADVSDIAARLKHPITYHCIAGRTLGEGIRGRMSGTEIRDSLPASYCAPLGFRNTLRAIRDTATCWIPYSATEMIEVYESVADIINRVAADLVVVDLLLSPALTACTHLGVHWAGLSPNSIKEVAARWQPLADSLLKSPVTFSGFRYPVPWYYWPCNVFYNLYRFYVFSNDPCRRQVANALKAATNADLMTTLDLLLHAKDPGIKVLVSTLPELDYPAIVPEHVLPCGPIISEALPLLASDPDLDAWLARRPTIYVNMGTLCKLSADQAFQIALALNVVLRESVRAKTSPSSFCTQSLQVLWKLQKVGDFPVLEQGSDIHTALQEYVAQDRVRIVDWIQARPSSILESGQIVCAVHHGGANSYHDAIVAGVPQVALPKWTDCYDYAQKIEMLGVGKQGNIRHQPGVQADELAQALLEIVASPRTENIRLRARHFASLCQSKGNGAANAAQILLNECASVRESGKTTPKTKLAADMK